RRGTARVRRKATVDAADGVKQEHHLAVSKIGDHDRVAETEDFEQRRLGKAGLRLWVVEVGTEGIGTGVAAAPVFGAAGLAATALAGVGPDSGFGIPGADLFLEVSAHGAPFIDILRCTTILSDVDEVNRSPARAL